MEKKIALFNAIENAIKAGVNGSKLADAFEKAGMNRKQALALIASVGAFMNMQSGMTLEDGFRVFTGI